MKNNTVVFDDFFSADECSEFLARHTGDFKHMDVLGNEKEHRVAHGKWIFDENDIFVERFKLLVCALTGIPITHQEAPHLVKYDVGGKYDAHHDFFHPNTDYYEGHTKVGGQRVVSSLLYLNEDFLGGETEFPKREKIVTPKTGRILSWRNVKLNDELDYDSLHAGKPVISGTKYILIIWTRERDLKNNNAMTEQQPKSVVNFDHTPIKQDSKPAEDFSKLNGQFDIQASAIVQNDSRAKNETEKISQSTLRDLTANEHARAENTPFMRLFAANLITPDEYTHYLTQMVLIYTALEGKLMNSEIMKALPGIERTPNMRKDLAYYTSKYGVKPLNPVAVSYYNDILKMNIGEVFAHYYVRAAGDLFGGQMLKKLVHGANSWYDFGENEAVLRQRLRSFAVPELAPDVKRAYERNIELLNSIIFHTD
jgi:prolyl 4-hydroxylase